MNSKLTAKITVNVTKLPEFERVLSQLAAARKLLVRLTGKEMDWLANDMDHRNKDYSKWYRAVKTARKFLKVK